MQDRLLDVAVVGGGIVGLATAFQLLHARPALRVAVIEKEAELGTHQTGHNSGVLHAGVYYAPGSLKARLCREGKLAVERFADEHDIAYRHCGKLIVAVDEREVPGLMQLKQRAAANGVEGLEEVGPERIRELEPHVVGLRALWSPRTGIIDSAGRACLRGRGVGEGRLGVVRRPRDGSSRHVKRADRHHLGRSHSSTRGDRLRGTSCRSTRRPDRRGGGPRTVPFRGDYYTLIGEARQLVNGLVYPVPDPRFPFLGVHFTRRIDDQVWAGPNAVLAFAREGYRRRDIVARDFAETLTFPGFWRLARPHLRTGFAEMWRDVWKPAFVASLQRYIPELRADQLRFGPSGVRAQAVSRNGVMVDDFAINGTANVLHVINAPSPAATSSLAVGSLLAETGLERFSLG